MQASHFYIVYIKPHTKRSCDGNLFKVTNDIDFHNDVVFWAQMILKIACANNIHDITRLNISNQENDEHSQRHCLINVYRNATK